MRITITKVFKNFFSIACALTILLGKANSARDIASWCTQGLRFNEWKHKDCFNACIVMRPNISDLASNII